MNPNESGPVVLLTGAGGGLGQAMTNAFVGAGWRVAAAGHSAIPTPRGDRVWCCRLDVRDAGAVQAVVDEIALRWGRLDALVCNAGIVRDRLLSRMDAGTWNDVVEVHLKGAFLCARAVLTPMLRQRSGHMVMIASHAARLGAIGQTHYSAAKAGMIGLMLSLAREVGPQGICVNAVLPGVMPTGMTAGLPTPILSDFVSASVLRQTNAPDNVASWIVHLAESRHVSGQVFALDGRITRWT